jgi:hypothetical protein
MTWSLVIIDDGITNATQRQLGKSTTLEFDFYYGVSETDDGVANTHGNKVFQAALQVSRAYNVVDLKVASASLGDYGYIETELALRAVIDRPEVKVGAINMSFGGAVYPHEFADEISQLAARGIISVVAAGNGGSDRSLEAPSYPAALPDVICVGSHDGSGNPSDFSQNGRQIDILADGEDVPRPGVDGTSFATPRVAATITHVQAIVDGLTGHVLSIAQMVDALQQGGAGLKSQPDPADGQTRYFLHNHNGSLDYAWSHYGGSQARALEYVASHRDLIAAIGTNADAGRLHFERLGSIEERGITFDGLSYVAANSDLLAVFGTDELGSARHYIAIGQREGRATTFDSLDYIASYGDLISAVGANEAVGTFHYVSSGYREGRTTSFDGLDYIASYGDLIAAFGTDGRSGSIHFIQNGFREGRSASFDGLDYIASYGDLITAFGADEQAGGTHFIARGNGEGRVRDSFDERQYHANYADLRAAFGTDLEAATRHFINAGYAEGRTDDPLRTGASTDFLI